VNELSLPPVKIHCSVLAEDAIKAAINDYKTKQGSKAPAQSEAKVN
jgi:nitrogen fixation NifU-like protein